MNNTNFTHSITMPYPISTNRYYRNLQHITTLSKEGRLFKQMVRLDTIYVLSQLWMMWF